MLAHHEKINLVMFNMSSYFDWDHGIVNRNYNILQALAEEDKIEKIVAVDFLPIGFKKTIGHFIKNILFEKKSSEMIYGDLTSACWQKTDKIYVYSTVDSFFSHKTVANELKRIEKILNLKNVVFWSYNPLFTDFIGKLNEHLFVFDAVDDWSEHPSYTKLMSKQRILNNYKTISEKAQVVFTVSEHMKDMFKEFDRTEDVYWVPNGVDYDHFNNPDLVDKTNDISEITKPVIGYLGTIEERIDFELLAKIAQKNPDKELVLCGPVWPSVRNAAERALKHFQNVHWLGRVAYDDAPSYLKRFDVAIIPHKLNHFVNSMNPMKLYDYLACGLPVVTTNGAGVEKFKNDIYIAQDSNDFLNLIDRALKEDSDVKHLERQLIVKDHTWEKRADMMTKIIYSKIFHS
ncbi:MAG: hypothetical protein UT32_C0009G0060 [Parcubacteria group bacterium GW2011_GWC2_39_14]|nr:MAG: hypothetical protein UT32_C0009G0060 [Parcubacteria group bacterium GW2011_GWC2_39_14]KKR55398.1 MAG: hypothetical protein UT91_C0002G0059 [Parcubacteria group bacterium GW2011_GWA2_40_23]